MQWHGSKDTFLFEPGKYPPLDLAIVNRRWEITRSWDHRIRTTKTKTGNVEGMALVGGTPMRVGQWAHWVFHVHWSTTDAGRVEAWLDGRKIADVKGPNAHRDLIGPYFKAGVYVPGWGYRGIEQGIRERVLLFDDVDTAYGANPFGLNPSQ
jgi:hypothetical protein